MPIHVRAAGQGDLDAIVEFNRRLAEESEGKALDLALLRSGVAAMLADTRKGVYFVAETEKTVIGQLGITQEWSDWRHGWFWWIQSVYVLPDWRRRGVFRALFRFVEQSARSDDEVIGIRLYVERDNRAAQQTYAKLGLERSPYFIMERYPLTP